MINLGQTGITNIYIGGAQVTKVFLCTDLVWPSTPVTYGEIYYTATSKVTPYDVTVFGATYLPEESTFDETTGEGVLKFDGDVISIGYQAFHSCNNLTSVAIPNGVISIGDYVFDDCSNLTAVTIPNSVTSIGRSTFRNCNSLTSIEIPNSVISIGNSAFSGCSGLTSVTIPNSVTSIGDGAFYGCSSLTSVTIPNSVTSIGRGAFQYCSGLTSMTIPNSVTSIRDQAFDGCTDLTSVTCEATTPPTLSTSVFYNTNNCPIYVPTESVDSYKSATNWSNYASRIAGYN